MDRYCTIITPPNWDLHQENATVPAPVAQARGCHGLNPANMQAGPALACSRTRGKLAPVVKTFDSESQERFAALSGDFNPMHMDAIAARRTLAGARVVHGIHGLLWLLDDIAATRRDLPPPTALKVRFRKTIYLDDCAYSEIRTASDVVLRARILVDGMEVLTLTVEFGSPAPAQRPFTSGGTAMVPPQHSLDLALDQLVDRRGNLRFATSAAAAQSMFPNASRYLGADRVAALACCSCLVGMVVPGLHSLFGGLDLSLHETNESDQALEFAVTSVHQQLRLVHIAVYGGGLSGTLETVSRPPPAAQPTTATLASSVARNEFLDATALVIGGSRGLGEVTAKLVASGGGRVIVTYARGQADAAAVAADINDWGGRCETAFYDVLQDATAQVARLPRAPTHVYYFATPTIWRRKAALCVPERFQEFNSFYVAGFFAVIMACLGRRPEGIRVFYPSTVYVDSRPADMTEYVMSKAAGEILCADLNQHQRGIRVLVERLPRAATDQTGSIVPTRLADAASIMLPIIAAHALRRCR